MQSFLDAVLPEGHYCRPPRLIKHLIRPLYLHVHVDHLSCFSFLIVLKQVIKHTDITVCSEPCQMYPTIIRNALDCSDCRLTTNTVLRVAL